MTLLESNNSASWENMSGAFPVEIPMSSCLNTTRQTPQKYYARYTTHTPLQLTRIIPLSYPFISHALGLPSVVRSNKQNSKMSLSYYNKVRSVRSQRENLAVLGDTVYDAVLGVRMAFHIWKQPTCTLLFAAAT